MFLGSSKCVYIDALLSVEATSESAFIVYDLRIICEEGCDYKGRTEGRRGGGILILVSFVVWFKLCIRLARF